VEGVRPAVVHDLPILLELSEGLRTELDGFRGGDLWLQTHQPIRLTDTALHELLAADDALVLVGCIDESVVGYAFARVDTYTLGTTLCTISELFVEPEARDVGVGESLVDAVVAWAGDRGCVGVDATALPGHRVTKNFFEGAGFVARSLTMHRSLSGGAERGSEAGAHAQEPPR
jgi:GNAT superfamily N-acetyltransferase